MRKLWLCLSCLSLVSWGQTQIDLQKQGRNVDFSNASTTRPVKTGTSLPASCLQGELFFNSAAAAGVNLYGCVSTNVWVLLGDGGGTGGGASLPAQTGNETKVLTTNGVTAAWEELEVGSGLSRTQQAGTKVFSADSTQIPFLALDNAFLGDNEFAGVFTTTPGATQTLTALTPVSAATTHMAVTAATAITLTSTPTIADGRDGQIGVLVNTGSNVITFRDEANLAGTNLCLTGDMDVSLVPAASLSLMFSTGAGCWVQIGGTGVGGGGVGLGSLGGQTGPVQSFATGTAGNDFTVSSADNTHTFNLPSAGPSTRGVITTGAQSLAGKKTFTPTVAEAGLNVGTVSVDPSTASNGDIWYNTATSKLRCREGNTTKDCVFAGTTIPAQSGNANRMLTTDGTALSWEALNAGQGMVLDQQAGQKVVSVDETQVPFLALNNSFAGDNEYAGRTVYVPSSEQLLDGSSAVAAGASHARVSALSAVTLTSTPTVADGVDGQTLVIVNTGAHTVTFQDEQSLPGSNLCLAGDANAELAAHSSVSMLYSGAAGCWVQLGGTGAAVSGALPKPVHSFYCGPGTSAIVASTSSWCGLGYTSTGASANPRAELPVPLDEGESCTVSNLRVRTSSSAAPLNLSGGTLRVDVVVNGTVSGVHCTVNDGDSSCLNTTDTAAVTAGAFVTFKLTSGAYSSAPYIQASFDCRQ